MEIQEKPAEILTKKKAHLTGKYSIKLILIRWRGMKKVRGKQQSELKLQSKVFPAKKKEEALNRKPCKMGREGERKKGRGETEINTEIHIAYIHK